MATRAHRQQRTRELTTKGNIVTPERAAAMDRTRENLMRGRSFSDSSSELIGEAREERTARI